MTPVFDLSRAEAVSELEGLLDLRPSQDSPLEFATWAKAHQERVAQLEVWILTHPEPTPNPPEVAAPPLLPPSAPLLEDTSMPQSKTPQQKLDTMMVRLRTYIAENKPRLASQLRSHIRTFCAQAGLQCPELPRNPGKSCGAPVPEDLRPVVRQTEQALAEHLGLPPERVHAASAAATHGPKESDPSCEGCIRIIRQDIWALMGFLESLPEAERGEARLVAELANLDAAAHLVATFAASGRIEVLS